MQISSALHFTPQISPKKCFLNLIFWHIQINKVKEKADKYRLLSILAEAVGFEPYPHFSKFLIL